MALIGVEYKPVKKFAFRANSDTPSICDFCGAKGTVIFQKFKGVFEIINIPLFPIRGTVGTVCESCGGSCDEKDLGAINYDLAQRIISKKASVISDYIGLLIFPFLLTVAYCAYMITQTADFMVDNGSNRTITISYKSAVPFLGKPEVSKVGAGKYQILKIPYNTNAEVVIEENPYNFNIVKGKKYVFNVDTIHSYFETEVMYKWKSIFSLNNNDDISESPKTVFLPKKLFFETKVDYFIEAPSSLSKDEMKGKDEMVVKRVLYRFSRSEKDTLFLQ
jgi:hypothetical protein